MHVVVCSTLHLYVVSITTIQHHTYSILCIPNHYFFMGEWNSPNIITCVSIVWIIIGITRNILDAIPMPMASASVHVRDVSLSVSVSASASGDSPKTKTMDWTILLIECDFVFVVTLPLSGLEERSIFIISAMSGESCIVSMITYFSKEAYSCSCFEAWSIQSIKIKQWNETQDNPLLFLCLFWCQWQLMLIMYVFEIEDTTTSWDMLYIYVLLKSCKKFNNEQKLLFFIFLQIKRQAFSFCKSKTMGEACLPCNLLSNATHYHICKLLLCIFSVVLELLLQHFIQTLLKLYWPANKWQAFWLVKLVGPR